MEIEIQRDNRVCLEDYEWRKWTGRAVWFFNSVMLALMIMITPAHAAVEAVPPSNPATWINARCAYLFGHTGCTASTILEACNLNLTSSWGPPSSPVFNSLSLMGGYLGPHEIRYSCNYNFNFSFGSYVNYSLAMVYGFVNCPTPSTGNPYAYNPILKMCERTVPDCPANSTRSDLFPFQCNCNTGYKFDAIGGICVPLRECTIPDLPPITDPEVQLFEDRPNRADTERLSPRMKIAHKCLLDAAKAASPPTSPPSTGSAFRPPAYNQHLIDVWKKWEEFERNENYDQQDCAARKEKARLHFKIHGLKEKQPPVLNSLHTKGEAVDVTINLPPANIDALAATCRLYRPPSLRITDPVHFIYR